MNGLFVCWSRGWGVLSFSERLVIVTETAVYIPQWGRRGILRWRHSPKMADSEICVPVILLALASARRRSYLHALSIAPDRCVFARGNTQRQLVVSLLPETWLPCEESATDTGRARINSWIELELIINSIQFSMNWIGIELKDFELELNWNWKPELIGIDQFNQFIFNSTPHFTRLNILLYAILWKL